MHVRAAIPADTVAWLTLSREYDQYLDCDMVQWYDGFDAYMARKIAQREALIAVEDEICLGLIAFSRSHNRITFFGMSHAADEHTAEALLSAVLNELDTSRAITINTPKGDSPKLQGQKRFLESHGFAVYDDTVLENGCPMYGMRRPPNGGSAMPFPRTDITYTCDGMRFSYRVAGIVLHSGHVLLQNTERESGYAFPGGSAAFGETNVETLVREFREELGAETRVDALKWVEENFFSIEKTHFQQICLTYAVELVSEIPMEGRFKCREIRSGGNQVWFEWVPIERLRDSDITVYPSDAADLLLRLDQGVQHIVRR